jgi:hypothetical protein
MASALIKDSLENVVEDAIAGDFALAVLLNETFGAHC